jgi:hypothetical protein
VYGPLLVACQDELKFLFVMEKVEDIQHDAARISEYVPDAFLFQGFYKYF